MCGLVVRLCESYHTDLHARRPRRRPGTGGCGRRRGPGCRTAPSAAAAPAAPPARTARPAARRPPAWPPRAAASTLDPLPAPPRPARTANPETQVAATGAGRHLLLLIPRALHLHLRDLQAPPASCNLLFSSSTHQRSGKALGQSICRTRRPNAGEVAWQDTVTLPGISEKRVQAHAQLVMTQHAQQNGPETRCRMRMSQWKVLGRSHTCCSSGRRQGAVRLMTRPSPPGCGCAGVSAALHMLRSLAGVSACVCTDQPSSRGFHVAFSSSSFSKQGDLRGAPHAALARRRLCKRLPAISLHVGFSPLHLLAA